MKAFKTIALLALALCMVFAFAACAPQADKEPAASATPAATEAPADESAEATETPAGEETEAAGGTLTMATNAQFPPYEYYEGQEIVGIDAEIAQLIADKLGMELVIEDMEFDSILAAVQTKKVDMGMAGLTVTEERLVSLDFSTTYATGKQVIIVPEDSEIASPADLEGKKIGVQLSTTGDIYCSDEFGEEAMDRYSKGADAVVALTQGKVDAVVIDNEPAKVFVQENEGLKILETEYAVEDYAIAVAKGNTSLLEKINAALAELSASGEIQAIIDKYISAE
jgi:polar amino acid transport system substrate-binding protein